MVEGLTYIEGLAYMKRHPQISSLFSCRWRTFAVAPHRGVEQW